MALEGRSVRFPSLQTFEDMIMHEEHGSAADLLRARSATEKYRSSQRTLVRELCQFCEERGCKLVQGSIARRLLNWIAWKAKRASRPVTSSTMLHWATRLAPCLPLSMSPAERRVLSRSCMAARPMRPPSMLRDLEDIMPTWEADMATGTQRTGLRSQQCSEREFGCRTQRP